MKYISVILLLVWASNVTCSPLQKDCGDKVCAEVSTDQSPRDEQYGSVVKFYLYNKHKEDGSEGYSVYDRRDIKTVFNKFDSNLDTKIIIHGWMDDRNSTLNTLLTEAYLTNYDYNVIVTDWSGAGSKNIIYPLARNMVPIIAYHVYVLIELLCLHYDLKPDSFHLIGHSLGAHIAGIAGKKVAIGDIGRITGLDPAGPLFSIEKPEERLSEDSAQFVDVIHTCGLYLGFAYQMGHADFLPNGGHWLQPGCAPDISGACSHSRSYHYFAESIWYPNGYKSKPCSNWNEYVKNKCEDKETVMMGAFAPPSARGTYFLKTFSEAPFYL